MAQYEIYYTLKKISTKVFQQKSDGYKQFILEVNNNGRYVVALDATGHGAGHCISVDCENKKIFDCMESYVLPLTESNLDRCVGKDHTCVKSIPLCYEVIEQQKKSKKVISNPKSSSKKMRKKRKGSEMMGTDNK